MRNILKWFIIILSTLIVLMVLLLTYAYQYLDAEKANQILSEAFAEHYQRELSIRGNIVPDWMPLRLKLTDVSISERFDTSEKIPDTFVQIGSLSLGVKWLALLDNRIVIEKVSFSDARINLVQYPDDTFNFSDLLASTPQSYQTLPVSTEASQPPQKATQAPASLPHDTVDSNFSWKIDSVDIQKLTINYLNEKNAQNYRLHVSSARIHDIAPDQSSPFEMSTHIKAKNAPPLSNLDMRLEAKGELHWKKEESLNINALTLKTQGTTTLKDIGHINLDDLLAQAQINLSPKQADINIAKLSMNMQWRQPHQREIIRAHLSGHAQIRHNEQGLQINAPLKIESSGKMDIPQKDQQTLPPLDIQKLTLETKTLLQLQEKQLRTTLHDTTLLAQWKWAHATNPQTGQLKKDIASIDLTIPLEKPTALQASVENLKSQIDLQGALGHLKLQWSQPTLTLTRQNNNRGANISSNAIHLNAHLTEKPTDKNAKNPLSVDLTFKSALNGTFDDALSPQSLALAPLHIKGQATLPTLAKPLPFDLVGQAQTHLKNTGKVTFKGLLGDSQINLKTAIKSFSHVNIDSHLTLDHFNLDAWLPQESASTSPPPKPAKKTPSTDNNPTVSSAPQQTQNDIPIDFSALQGLKGSMNLAIGTLQARGVKASHIAIKLKSDGKNIRIHPLKLNIAEGTLQGKLTLKPVEQKLSLKALINQVQFGQLLKELHITDMVRGRARVDMNLNTKGRSLQAFKKNLNGQIDLLANDGGVKGFNLAQKIRVLQAKLANLKGQKAQSTTEAEKEQYTDFAELSGLFKVKNGVMHNKNLKMHSPYFRLKGSGQANIVDETLNFRTQLITTHSSQGQGAKHAKLSGGIPIHIHGTMQSPKINIDSQAIQKNLMAKEKAKIQQALKQEQAKAEQKLKEKQAKLQQELKAQAKAQQQQQRQKLQEKAEEAKEKIKQQLQNSLESLFK